MRKRARAAVLAAIVGFAGHPALGQKTGGIFSVYHHDSPASMSIHEEATWSVEAPMMAVFNNLVIYKQDEQQNRLDDIVPDLATEWSWNADKTALTFKLRQGVKWHDGEPFTAADVKCTWDLLIGKGTNGRLRLNPRKAWYRNLDEITTGGDFAVTFHLHRPQPAFIGLLASGYSPVYPCHVAPQDMRIHPIGTGPFKFVEYKPNEYIKLAKNPDYWKPGRPYLDGIEYTIVPSRATAILGLLTGRFDMTFPFDVTVALMKDVARQDPSIVCDLEPAGISANLIVNRDNPPFDNPDLRRAVAYALDRKAFIDILAEGHGDIGGAMQPLPQGVWGMPPEMLAALPGYGPDLEKNRAEGRKIMQSLGYGPDKHMPLKVSARNLAIFRDPAVILIDQLKQIFIDGELDTTETANWFPKVARHDYALGINQTGIGVDDPDAQFYENYACGSERNYTGYCNKEIDTLFDRQSEMSDQDARKKLVWEIDKKLQEDGARPILYHNRFATCWQKTVKGLTIMQNSLYNGWRFEDIWLDR
jgi:peptide/nickel transport system substrate-binding protein